MKCINCVYHYITPEDKYSCCHFKPIANTPMKTPKKKNQSKHIK